MKQKLTIAERLNLQTLCPKKGNRLTINIADELISKLSLSSEEIEKYEVKQSVDPKGNAITIWDKDKAEDVEFDFLKCEIDVLKKEIEKLDKSEDIPVALNPVIKIVDNLNDKIQKKELEDKKKSKDSDKK